MQKIHREILGDSMCSLLLLSPRKNNEQSFAERGSNIFVDNQSVCSD